MNNLKKKLFTIILLAIVFFVPIFTFAEDAPPPTVVNPIGVESVQELIKQILEGVVKIGVPIVVLAIVYCGFLFVSARGNPKEIESAKRALIYTLIGAAILLGAWAIAQLISDTVLSIKA